MRSVPDKFFGVFLLLFSIISLFILIFLKSFIYGRNLLVASSSFSLINQIIFWIFFFNSLMLGFIGQKPVTSPFYEMGQISTLLYFFLFYLIALGTLIDIFFKFFNTK